MGPFETMLRNVIMFALLAVPGFLLVKCRILKQEHSHALSKLLMYVGMPFMILSGTVEKLSLNGGFIVRLLVVAIIGIAYTFAMFFVTKPLTAGVKDSKVRGMMRFCATFTNNGFLGLPLAREVFKGTPAFDEIFPVLVILNIITNIMMYTLGAYLVSGDKKSIGFKKAFLNPVLIAFVIGIVLNLLKVDEKIPEVLTFSNHFSNIVTPISMTILGIKLATVKLSSLFTSVKGYFVSFLKLIAFPVIIVAIMFALKFITGGIVNDEVVIGFFVAFAMPTAGLASTFADMYSGDSKGAVVFTLGSTMFSILTIPILYGLLTLIVSV